MTPEVKEELRKFSREFWSVPENVERLREQRARSTLGKFYKFGRPVASEEDFMRRCFDLGLPYLEFVTEADSKE